MPINEFILQLCGTPSKNMAVLVLCLAAMSGLGWAVRLRCEAGRNDQSAGTMAFEMVLGMNLLALCALFFNPGIIMMPRLWLAGVLLLPASAGVWRIGAWVWSLRQKISFGYWMLPVALLAAWQLYTLGSAWILPYGWDEQTYQLAVPARWMREGMAAVYEDNPYSAFPLFGQFAMLPGLRLGGLLFGKIFVWAGYGLLAILCYATLNRIGNRWIALVLTAVLMGCSAMLTMQRHVYAELFLMLNLNAALLYGVTRRKEGSPVIWGILAGGAAAVKLTGVWIALVIGLLFAVNARRRSWKVWGAAALCAAAVCGVFYLRTFLATGNPFFPFLASFFAPGDVAARATELFHRELGSVRYGIGGWASLGSSWVLAAFNEKIFDGVVLGYGYLLLTVSAIVGSWYFWHRKRMSPYAAQYLIAAILFYVLWQLSAPQTRFLLPGFLLILCAAAVVLRKMTFGLRTAALVAAALTLPLADHHCLRHFEICWRMVQNNKQQPVKLLGHATRDPGYYAMMEYMQRELPSNAMVLLLGEARALYMVRSYRIVTPGFQSCSLTGEPDVEAFARLAEKERAHYLLVGGSRMSPDFIPAHEELLRRHIGALAVGIAQKRYTLLYSVDGYNLIQLHQK